MAATTHTSFYPVVLDENGTKIQECLLISVQVLGNKQKWLPP